MKLCLIISYFSKVMPDIDCIMYSSRRVVAFHLKYSAQYIIDFTVNLFISCIYDLYVIIFIEIFSLIIHSLNTSHL